MFKGDQSHHGRFNKAGSKTEGSGAGEGLEVADEEKSSSAAYSKGIEAQAYEEP